MNSALWEFYDSFCCGYSKCAMEPKKIIHCKITYLKKMLRFNALVYWKQDLLDVTGNMDQQDVQLCKIEMRLIVTV
jgi:hypothetical protein